MQTSSLKDIQKQIAVLEIAERFFDSVALIALFEAGVFKILSGGPRTLAEIQERIGGNQETLRATLDAAVALELLTFQDGRYDASEPLLECLGREDSKAYLGEWIAFLQAFMKPLADLGQMIKTKGVAEALLDSRSGSHVLAKRMAVAMDVYARSRGTEIAERLDFSKTRRLLDMGCGPGTYSVAILERNPNVRATLVDLSDSIAAARRLAAARKVADRLEFITADAVHFTSDERFDTILVSNILHMVGPAASRDLLKRAFDLLLPGGHLIVQAQYLDEERVSPRWPTLVSLMLRVATPDGRNHAIGETKQWMEEAGFRNVHHVRFSVWNVCSCLLGERPVSG